jgi:predicted peptidase
MKKVVSLFTIGVLVMWLAVSCKKDADSPSAPPEKVIVETEPAVIKPVTVNIYNNCKGYVEALPALYDSSTKKYPLLIYFHGAGQIGNGSSELTKLQVAGISKLLVAKTFPPNFVVNHENFSFIVLLPQFTSEPKNDAIKAFVDYAKAHYRYDPSRVYLAGYSMGARVLTEFASTYPGEQTAIVPMAGAVFYDLDKKAKNIADNKVAAWLFHNQQDQLISVNESINFVNAVNKFNPSIPAKITIFPTTTAPQGHDAWTIPTDPGYRENGKNIYEWMLSYKK